MMTNTLENRGVENKHLIEFSKKYNVHPIESNFNYEHFRKTTHTKKEVIITNYERDVY